MTPSVQVTLLSILKRNTLVWLRNLRLQACPLQNVVMLLWNLLSLFIIRFLLNLKCPFSSVFISQINMEKRGCFWVYWDRTSLYTYTTNVSLYYPISKVILPWEHPFRLASYCVLKSAEMLCKLVTICTQFK